MRNTLKFRFAGIGIMLAMYAVFGAAVMLLWNALMPPIFGLTELNYLQAAGILVLGRLLFGGMGSGWHDRSRGMGRHHLFHHGNELREKWMTMSEDERREFIEKEKDFFKFSKRFSHFRDFYGDEPNKDNRHE